jgi:hypothetical protein
MDSSLERQIQGMAFTRIGLGIVLMLLPGPLLRIWLGRGASSPFSRLLARSVGGRDVALGLGTLFALRHRAPVRGWLEATALADASDSFTMLMAARHLSRPRLVLALLPTFGAIGYQRTLVTQVAADAPTETAQLP